MFGLCKYDVSRMFVEARRATCVLVAELEVDFSSACGNAQISRATTSGIETGLQI